MVMSDDELTPSEKEEMETLPRERMPSAGLEDSVVGMLRRERILRGGSRVIRLTGLRVGAAVAACAALLITGFALGQWTTQREFSRASTIVVDGSKDVSPALALQRAGTTYLLALERFASLSDSSNAEIDQQGREVALRTLYTAANQVTRIVPKRYLAGQLLQSMDVSAEPEDEKAGKEEPKFMWF
jgi:hypothetical protein